ncbi:alpha/beta hydrolase family esterase [Pseudorhodoferax sp.]|uniref:extracellular catalytic domain type 1 short-chain-length polyhydroxyalkanoate depolymerase n=1 Tax=Pseudorhodoferax sp. TaxID=1993553 RepID=UPI0039E5FD6D
MKHFFPDLLEQATRLTRAGDLQAATALIQRALGGHAPAPQTAPADDGLVIDAETRVVDDDPATLASPAASSAPADPAAAGEQWLHGQHAHGGRQIRYRLYVPPAPAGAAAAAKRPLVLMLHGCTQDPDDFAAGTRMDALAREAGVLVLYPEQPHRANAHGCWNWFKPQHQQRERGEPALLASLVRTVAAAHGADPARLYVAGLSAGGAMADILGRAYPDLFAAVGVHSGVPAGAAADLPAALAAMRDGGHAGPQAGAAVRPLIVFHGDADATVHPANGAALAEAARQGQPQAGPAETRRGQTPDGRRFTQTVFRAPGGASLVEYWQLHGLGHAWSGGSAAGSHAAPGGVDASAEMLRFFLSHRQPSSA